MKPKLFSDLAKCLCDALPTHLKEAKQDLEKNFHIILQNTFHQLELVTREEFDAQTKVLARSRKKIEDLEARIRELEQNLTEQ